MEIEGGRPASLGDLEDTFSRMVDAVGAVVKGKRHQVGLTLMAMIAGGHVLIEDNPGTGKTTLAKAIAAVIGGEFNRVQFTPDLLPSDITGGAYFDQKDGAFRFRRGPVFSNVLLADEINRASPKTQSALLQVMEEREVTLDGTTYPVAPPFVVLATQNPIEHEGTYRLPQAQVDRFMIKLSIGYPDPDAGVEMLQSIIDGHEPRRLAPLLDVDGMRVLGELARSVQVTPPVQRYIIDLCDAARSPEQLPELRLGVSPRGAVALMRMAQVLAAVYGRPYVVPDDVKQIAPYVLTHRLLLSPEAELQAVDPASLVARVLDSVQVPQPLPS